MFFFVFVIFSYLLYECVPYHTRPYIKYFQKVEPKHYLHLETTFLQLVAKRRPNDFVYFEPPVDICKIPYKGYLHPSVNNVASDNVVILIIINNVQE